VKIQPLFLMWKLPDGSWCPVYQVSEECPTPTFVVVPNISKIGWFTHEEWIQEYKKRNDITEVEYKFSPP